MQKYHMNKREREITDKKEIEEILSNGKYAVISMCRDNEPYIVTLSYGYNKDENALYFHSAKKGLKLDFIKRNPLVCATVIEDGGYKKGQCGHEYRSVVFWGNISVVDNLEEKKKGMEVLLYHLEDTPDSIMERKLKNDKAYNKMTVLKLEISHITGKKGK